MKSMLARLLIPFAVLCFIVGAIGYRQNLVTAYAKEQAILDADQADKDTTEALKELKAYSASHMHADVSFHLGGAYTRAVEAAQAKAAADTPTNTADPNLYAMAQAACNKHTNSVVQSNCVVAYVSSHQPAGPTQIAKPPVVLPDPAEFNHITKSPVWSWDIAGVSLALGVLSLVVALILAIQSHQHAVRKKHNGLDYK